MRSDNMPRPFAPEHSEPDIVERLLALEPREANEVSEVMAAAADEIDRLREECDALGRANESVAVCAGHTSDITEGDCYVCRLAAASDEIERARFDIGEYQRNLDSEVAARLAAESELSKLKNGEQRTHTCASCGVIVVPILGEPGLSRHPHSTVCYLSGTVVGGDAVESIREFAQLRLELSKLKQDVASLTEQRDRLRRLESDAARHVEIPIVQRTHFTGEEPYVGWKGVGLALTETLDQYDKLRERVEKAPVATCDADEWFLGGSTDELLSDLDGKRVRLVVEDE